MRASTLALCLGLALISTEAFSQVIACRNMSGDWEDYFSFDKYHITQDANGNLAGYMTVGGCTPNPEWPISGTISPNQFKFTATNNGCSNSNAAWVKFAGTLGDPGCNFIYGTYTNSVGGSGGFGDSNPYPTMGDYVTKAVDLPTSESSVNPSGVAWDKVNGGAPWNQTLSPNLPSGEFEGRGVHEFVSGTGSDSCWFTQSKFPPFTSITKPGFGWIVNSKNGWGTDWIGWTLAAVQYYRTQKRVPCGTRFYQQAVIDAAFSPNNPPSYSGPYTSSTGQTFYGVPYEVNTLGGDITATEVTSVRNGQVAKNTTWK